MWHSYFKLGFHSDPHGQLGFSFFLGGGGGIGSVPSEMGNSLARASMFQILSGYLRGYSVLQTRGDPTGIHKSSRTLGVSAHQAQSRKTGKVKGFAVLDFLRSLISYSEPQSFVGLSTRHATERTQVKEHDVLPCHTSCKTALFSRCRKGLEPLPTL